jgi:hypothetical protein
VQFYFNLSNINKNGDELLSRKDRYGNGQFHIASYMLLNKDNEPVAVYKSGEEARIQVAVKASDPSRQANAFATLVINDLNGNRIFGLASAYYRQEIELSGDSTITWIWPRCQLAPGEYSCHINIYESKIGGVIIDSLQDAFRLNIEEADYFGRGVIPNLRQDKVYSEFEVRSARC